MDLKKCSTIKQGIKIFFSGTRALDIIKGRRVNLGLVPSLKDGQDIYTIPEAGCLVCPE